jgi:hypothetical protein
MRLEKTSPSTSALKRFPEEPERAVRCRQRGSGIGMEHAARRALDINVDFVNEGRVHGLIAEGCTEASAHPDDLSRAVAEWRKALKNRRSI